MSDTRKPAIFTRRTILVRGLQGGLAGALLGSGPLLAAQSGGSPALDVYKDPTCGCCNGWIEHMRQSGFDPVVHHPDDLNAIKQQHGVQPELQSCHTAVTGAGHVFEGHVPAKFIRQFLAELPADGRGLSAPGMPLGTPGMEMGDSFTPYDVLLMKRDGSVSVFARVEKRADQF